jgi:hypothetical protein
MSRRAAQPWSAVTLRAVATPLATHAAPILAEDSASGAPASKITVTAPRGLTVGGIAPLLELSPSELESYGADSLSDLVDALKYLTCESAVAARESRQIAWNFAQELILRKR